METTVEQGRHFPQMPSVLPGESDGEYTDRLTGADGTDRVPYDHERNRQCAANIARQGPPPRKPQEEGTEGE